MILASGQVFPHPAVTSFSTPQFLVIATLVLALASCGAAPSSNSLHSTAPAVSIAVSPTVATVQPGAKQQFTATVSGVTSANVTWSVSGIAGGNATVGTVTSAGLYTAPATAPSSAVTLTATYSQDTVVSATATINVVAPGVTPIVMKTNSLPGATVGSSYSAALSATGGTPPYSWSVVSGQLPAGLVLSGAAIRGTPTAPGTVSFSLQVKDSASSPQAATQNESIAVASSSASGPVDVPHFSLQPATGVFADSGGGYTSAQCAAVLDANASVDMYNGKPINQETVPQNQLTHAQGSPADGIISAVNQTKPTASQLAYYASDGYRSSLMDSPYTWMKKIDGQYTGTTEMIIRWAACKWGMDEDMIRAQAETENWSWVQWNAGGDERTSTSQCQAGSSSAPTSTNLWNYVLSNACYQSWSNWQTKVVYLSPNQGAWTTWPAINESTAFAADYRYGEQRSCMNGALSGYFQDKGATGYLTDVNNAKTDPNGQSAHAFMNPVTGAYATNLEYVAFGCLGTHSSGGWMDSGAQSYLGQLLNYWASKNWLPK